MRFEINLAEDGPPFWILGEPHDIRIHLSLGSPGPVSVNFNELSDHERSRIMLDLQRGQIECDVDMIKLHDAYLQLQKPPAPNEAAQAHLEQKARHEEAQKVLKERAKREKDQQKFDSKLQWLCKMSARALKSSLVDEDNIRMLRSVRDAELARKRARPSIVRYIDEKLKRIQVGVLEEIERNKADEKVAVPKGFVDRPSKTFVSDVIESENEIVELSNEDLKRLASGEEL